MTTNYFELAPPISRLEIQRTAEQEEDVFVVLYLSKDVRHAGFLRCNVQPGSSEEPFGETELHDLLTSLRGEPVGYTRTVGDGEVEYVALKEPRSQTLLDEYNEPVEAAALWSQYRKVEAHEQPRQLPSEESIPIEDPSGS